MYVEIEGKLVAARERKWAAFDRAFAASYDRGSARTPEEEAAASAAYEAAVAEYWDAEDEAAAISAALCRIASEQ